MYVNTVGTFGIGSALGRLSQYLAAIETSRGTCLVADDYHLETSGCDYRPAIFVFFVLCATAGVPPLLEQGRGRGHCIQGGVRAVTTASSSSESHSAARNGSPGRLGTWRRQTFSTWPGSRRALGRVMYVLGALDYERHFLVPPHKFLTIHPRGSVRRVPAYILSYLSLQTGDSTHCACAEELARMTSAPRVDAQGVSHAPGLVAGSHMLVRTAGVDVSRSRWYSHEITRSEWPWCLPKMTSPRCSSQRLTPLAVLAALNCSTRTPRTSSVSVSRSSRRGRTTGERNCAQPAHVHQVRFFRGHHGACSLHEEGLDQGARGVVAPVRQRGGRLAGQWELRRGSTRASAAPSTLPTWTGCFSRKLSRSDVQLNRISRMRKPGSTPESRYETKEAQA